METNEIERELKELDAELAELTDMQLNSEYSDTLPSGTEIKDGKVVTRAKVTKSGDADNLGSLPQPLTDSEANAVPQEKNLHWALPFGGTSPWPFKNRKVTTKNIAIMVYINEDGTRVIDRLESFTLAREHTLLIGYAVFRLPRGKGKFGLPSLKRGTKKVLFNSRIAEPSLRGWVSYHDALTYQQIPPVAEKSLQATVLKLNQEIEATTQGLIVANTEAERLKKKESFFSKYGIQLLSIATIFILAIALFQLGADIAHLNVSISTLQGAIGNLNPATAIGKAATSGIK